MHIHGVNVITLYGAAQVRSFAKERASTDRYGGAQDQVVKWGLFSARASGFFFGFNSVVGTGSIVFVLWFGARQVPLLFPLLMQRKKCAEPTASGCGLIFL